MSAMAELDAIRRGLITHMYLDITGWTRTPEVVDYALARGITVDAAVGELVNSGLSHLRSTLMAKAVGVVNPFKPGDIVQVGNWTKAYRDGQRGGRVLQVEDNLVEVGWPDNTAPTTFVFGDLKKGNHLQ